MKKFERGQKVVLKEGVKQLLTEMVEKDYDAYLRLSLLSIRSRNCQEHLLEPQELVISYYDTDNTVKLESSDGYWYPAYFFEPVQDEAEKLLTPGKIVELRNGELFMIGTTGYLFNMDTWSGRPSGLGKTGESRSPYDIVRVYTVDEVSGSCMHIRHFFLTENLKLEWEEPEEIKEISSQEAFEKLEQLYGCKVKIKKD